MELQVPVGDHHHQAHLWVLLCRGVVVRPCEYLQGSQTSYLVSCMDILLRVVVIPTIPTTLTTKTDIVALLYGVVPPQGVVVGWVLGPADVTLASLCVVYRGAKRTICKERKLRDLNKLNYDEVTTQLF